MPDTILLLEVEHDRIATVLDLVARHLANLLRHHPADRRLLQSALDYLSNYADQCHHPKEDLVYRKLSSRDPAMVQSLGALIEEHARIARLTASLSAALGELRPEETATSDRFAAQLAEFLHFYRHHMDMEERHFFPAALQSLTRDDWAEIDFRVFDQADPLLDRSAEARFAQLRDEIARLDKAQRNGDARREEAAWLGSLAGIADFNEAMRQRGEAARLNRSAEGGYEIERSGSVLLHIPQCSESRAAWCAYFFLKGQRPSRAPPGPGTPRAGNGQTVASSLLKMGRRSLYRAFYNYLTLDSLTPSPSPEWRWEMYCGKWSSTIYRMLK